MKNTKFMALIFTAFLALYSFGCVFAAAPAAKDIVSMKQHATEGVTCTDCHGTANPVAAPTQAGCLTCHANSDGTYRGELDANGNGVEKVYSESRKTKPAAMHDSHVGKLRCTLCHTSHKAPDSKNIYCNYCHQFDVVVK